MLKKLVGILVFSLFFPIFTIFAAEIQTDIDVVINTNNTITITNLSPNLEWFSLYYSNDISDFTSSPILNFVSSGSQISRDFTHLFASNQYYRFETSPTNFLLLEWNGSNLVFYNSSFGSSAVMAWDSAQFSGITTEVIAILPVLLPAVMALLAFYIAISYSRKIFNTFSGTGSSGVDRQLESEMQKLEKNINRLSKK